MKYEQGEKIETVIDAVERILKRQPFYYGYKFMAAGFIEHWSIVQIKNAVYAGRLRAADHVHGLSEK